MPSVVNFIRLLLFCFVHFSNFVVHFVRLGLMLCAIFCFAEPVRRRSEVAATSATLAEIAAEHDGTQAPATGLRWSIEDERILRGDNYHS